MLVSEYQTNEFWDILKCQSPGEEKGAIISNQRVSCLVNHLHVLVKHLFYGDKVGFFSKKKSVNISKTAHLLSCLGSAGGDQQ